MHWNISLYSSAISTVDYILPSHTLTFAKGESADANCTHCINVTLLDSGIAKNEQYLVIGLFPMPNDSAAAVVIPDKNETTIAIIDDNHGMCNE